MIKLEIIEFLYQDISKIMVPFIILIFLIVLMIGIMIYITKKELKKQGGRIDEKNI